MKKFLIKSTILFLIFSLILGGIVLLPPTNTMKNTNIFALPDKIELLKNTPQPRIIFIGGSNLSLGINSQMIKDSLHLNPVNMGIHAGLGLKYMLKNYLEYAKENDIVILSPEYQQFYGNLAEGDIILLSAMVDVVRDTKNCDYIQLFNSLKYVPEYASAKLNLWNYFKMADSTEVGIFHKKSFNIYGDTQLHWKLPKKENIKPLTVPGEFNKSSFHALINFKDELGQKNIDLFFAFPSYQESSFNLSKKQIKTIENEVLSNGFCTLGAPEMYITNDSLLFDSPYHLTKDGTNLRTSLIINELKFRLHNLSFKKLAEGKTVSASNAKTPNH